jgi:hypothetical protein
MAKRKVKKQKRRVRRRLPATVRTEPDRRPILGGGGSFSVLPANPFQEGLSNSMIMMQQNLNNNLNNQLNQMKAENQLLRNDFMTMQEDQKKLIEQGRLSNAQELKQQMVRYETELERRYNDVDRMQNLMAHSMTQGVPALTQGVPALTLEEDEQDDDDAPEQKPEDIIDIDTRVLIDTAKDLLTAKTSAKNSKSIKALKGNKLTRGRGNDWKPLREQLGRIPPKELFAIIREDTTPADRARKLVAKIESLPILTGGTQTNNPLAGASSSSTPSPARNTMTTQNDLVFTPA